MKYLTLTQVILAVVLAAVILVQQQGSGLGGAFGGEGATYHSRRGLEKFLFRATIFLGVLFFGLAIYSVKKGP